MSAALAATFVYAALARPFVHLGDPLEGLARMPTFVLGEHAILLAALLGLVHAFRTSAAHRLVWLAALVAGTANDLVFMALPLVDNFWHGQATYMLTPRLPLYIPALYVLFLYFPTVAVARLGRPRVATAAAAAWLAVLTYAPFDIVGAKFLWWTWHDTDPPTAARLFGVPTSSTLWVLTFTGAFAFWVAPLLGGTEPPTRRARAATLLRVTLATTPTMMLQMTPLQQVDGGTPGVRALVVGVVLYGLAIAISSWRARAVPLPSAPAAFVPVGAVALHLVALVVSVLAFDPGSHVSEGVHQTVGPCDVQVADITGLRRRAYLCARDYDEDFVLDCRDVPRDGTRWYTICGRPFVARAPYAAAVVGLAALAALAYVRLFAARRGTQARRAEEG